MLWRGTYHALTVIVIAMARRRGLRRDQQRGVGRCGAALSVHGKLACVYPRPIPLSSLSALRSAPCTCMYVCAPTLHAYKFGRLFAVVLLNEMKKLTIVYSTYEVIESVSAHVDDSSSPLPKDVWDKIVAARGYMSGTAMLRQLFFGTADMALHSRPAGPATVGGEAAADIVMSTFREVANEYTVMPPLEEDRFLCSFGHIFAGGYAAGYYSYKWAEVLSADAFAAFEEAGLHEHGLEHVLPVGKRFRQTVLGLGGSKHPMEVFVEFRGREPSVDALLRHNNLA